MNTHSSAQTAFPSDTVSDSGNSGVAAPNRTLLIVDDDPSVRHALWITFRSLYIVQLADSGAKAIELFRTAPADVAILDIRMPGMSGLELLKHIREIDSDLEVILLSAYETIEYAREAMRLGAAEYLTKPFQVEHLRTSVQDAMGRREVSRKTASYDKRLAQLQTEIQHQQMREELARTRNEIYGSIIHDINGPLTIIAAYADLMRRATANAENIEGDQLKTLRNQAESVSRQVSNCIELSRRYLNFLEGKVTKDSNVGIKEVFFDLAELLKSHPQVRANQLNIHSFEENNSVAIHRTDLLQVLTNLTVNALQCSPTPHRVEIYARIVMAGVSRTLSVTTPGVYLLRSPEFRETAPMAAISVQDNGPGISAALLPRIFEPYFTTRPPGHGSGLGLSIVHRLITLANGAIHVYSHPGEGTVFTVYLPLSV